MLGGRYFLNENKHAKKPLEKVAVYQSIRVLNGLPMWLQWSAPEKSYLEAHNNICLFISYCQ